MNILFVHQNFPGQFKFLAPALAELDHNVFAMTMQRVDFQEWNKVKIIPYAVNRSTSSNIHPWISETETKVIRGEAFFKAALNLKKNGFYPDIVIAHPGWGETIFLKDVWPKTRLGIYCEFFYHAEGADFGFDPEYNHLNDDDRCKLRLKNINNLLHLEIADLGISPTHWQASTFPERFKSKIKVIHDGIDTTEVVPNPNVRITLNNRYNLSKKDEIITFVNRNLEPYRGFHIFMRALPELLQKRKNARVLIVGGNNISYGAKPILELNGASSWKDVFISEVKPKLDESDWSRIHFLGNIPYNQFIPLLQISSVHVYLTYPFVLSWSLLEAMSAGCSIVASNTKPLHEAIRHNETGRLVPFFDKETLIENICDLLSNEEERYRLGSNAREFAIKNYDLKKVCLPQQLDWVDALSKLEI